MKAKLIANLPDPWRLIAWGCGIAAALLLVAVVWAGN